MSKRDFYGLKEPGVRGYTLYFSKNFYEARSDREVFWDAFAESITSAFFKVLAGCKNMDSLIEDYKEEGIEIERIYNKGGLTLKAVFKKAKSLIISTPSFVADFAFVGFPDDFDFCPVKESGVYDFKDSHDSDNMYDSRFILKDRVKELREKGLFLSDIAKDIGLISSELRKLSDNKGVWIDEGDVDTYYNLTSYRCSWCGRHSLEPGNYCPRCGSAMEEVDD